ncbi:reverse transcriptase domain-containing protein, partial [Pseudomonas aeruginosa]
IYLHYVLDLWARQWRQRHARGDVIIVRYADDSVVGFRTKVQAQQFLVQLQERLARFGLSLNASKTRLIEFGRFAARNRRGCGGPYAFVCDGISHQRRHRIDRGGGICPGSQKASRLFRQ